MAPLFLPLLSKFIVIAVAVILLVPISVAAQSADEIPPWVKGIAGWWADDRLTDADFASAIEYLIKTDIIKIPLIERLQDENAALKDEIIQLKNKDSSTHQDSLPSFTTPNTKDHGSRIQISTAEGSGVSGCEETTIGCYIPSIAKSNLGDTIVMSNTDTVAHTYTSGNPTDGPDDIFDSSLILTGSSYEWSPDTIGEYEYYCIVHPWMTGAIHVVE